MNVKETWGRDQVLASAGEIVVLILSKPDGRMAFIRARDPLAGEKPEILVLLFQETPETGKNSLKTSLTPMAGKTQIKNQPMSRERVAAVRCSCRMRDSPTRKQEMPDSRSRSRS